MNSDTGWTIPKQQVVSEESYTAARQILGDNHPDLERAAKVIQSTIDKIKDDLLGEW